MQERNSNNRRNDAPNGATDRSINRTYTTQIDDLSNDDIGLVGGKGANLGKLVRAGLPVPPRFVVTTAAYRDLTDNEEIQDTIDRLDTIDVTDSDELAATAEELRSLLREREFADSVEGSITGQLDTLGLDRSYAIRSSATAEDLPAASFAGQHETFLGVSGNDVLDRIHDCMVSLFTDRAIAYRARNDVSNADVEMAIVVQVMVDADVAGILFTADPDTGNRTVASVDATYGLGDAVVSGDVDADNARVDKEPGEVLAYEVGEKSSELRLDETGRGITTVNTPTERRETRALSDTHLRELVKLGERIEALFGEPQDIEWALVDDEFVLLQSRPITSLASLPEPLLDDDQLHVYFSLGHEQAMTDPMPPLALDLWTAVYNTDVNDFADSDRAWVTHIDGRIYVGITPFLGVRIARKATVAYIKSMNEAAGEGVVHLLEQRREEFENTSTLAQLPSILRHTISVFLVVTRLVPGTVRETVVPFLRGDVEIDVYREWWRVVCGRNQEARVLDTDNPKQLVANAFAGFPSEHVYERQVKSMRLMVGPTAGKLLQWLVPDADADLVTATARGEETEVGTRMTFSLGDLADTARETPAVEKAILDKHSLAEIREIEGSEPFVTEFEAFLEEFGHRAAGEVDPSRPRWRDDPTKPLGIIRGILIGEGVGAHRKRLRERKRMAAEAVEELRTSARRGFLGPIRRPLTDHLLRTYRSHIPLRDEPKHGIAYQFAAWHEALQRVGEHLIEEGVLAEADDVWYLRHEEVLDLLDDPKGDVPDLQARRTKHGRQKRTEAPPLITSEGEIPCTEQDDIEESTLVGTGVSSGIIEGTARIVHDPAETTLESGEILVGPSSDPAWTPLFATAGGFVTEVGGRLTHGALVAREYDLPAVVSVAGATDRIKDGQRICVDGNTGTVEILDD